MYCVLSLGVDVLPQFLTAVATGYLNALSAVDVRAYGLLAIAARLNTDAGSQILRIRASQTASAEAAPRANTAVVPSH